MSVDISEKNILGGSAKTITVFVFALFALYIDIFALKIPFFAFFICPILIVIRIGILIFRRVGVKQLLARCFSGAPAVLLALTIFTPILGQLHDQWLMQEIRDWGDQLRQQRMINGTYPKSQTRFIHGYPASLLNENPFEKPIIRFDRFGQFRQSYGVPDDRFREKQEN